MAKETHSSNFLATGLHYIVPLLWVLSLVALYRGHSLPGGGFIGGLVGAAAVLLLALGDDWERALKSIRLRPEQIMVIGILIAIAGGIIGIMAGGVFFQGEWLPFFDVPVLGAVKLGTPLIFDIGVYFTVIGFTVKCAHSLGQFSD